MKIESFDKEKSVVITTMGQKLVRELQSTTQEETIEKIAENESEYLADWEDKDMYKKGFVEGAKWQEERMYSEDEVDELVNNLIDKFLNYNGSSIDSEKLKLFYQQIKKK